MKFFFTAVYIKTWQSVKLQVAYTVKVRSFDEEQKRKRKEVIKLASILLNNA